MERHVGFGLAQKALHIMQITSAAVPLQPPPPQAGACQDEHVSRALLLMEQNVGTPVPVQEMSERLGLSKRNLEKLFHQHLGLTPKAAYMGLRLRHARRMLPANKALRLIAIETGFGETGKLSAAFKRAFGRSLSQERRRMRWLAARSLTDLHGGGEARRVFE
jgi:transcriptional regulator GlxA family with amidase domain